MPDRNCNSAKPATVLPVENVRLPTMTSRQRVRAVLNHKQPDRIPLDIGGTDITGVHAGTYRKLQIALGLPDIVPRVFDTFQMLAEIEEPVRKALEVDVVGLTLPYTIFGYRNENWKPFQMPDGTEVMVSGHFTVERLSDGSLVQFPQGDNTCAPSGRMTSDGFYFDVLSRQAPINEKTLDARRWVEETYRPIREEDLRELERRSYELFENTEYAIIADLNPAGFGGFLALMAPYVKQPTGIRDPEDFWMSYLIRKSYIEELFACQYDLQMKNLERYRQALGDRIDVMIMSKTDFGAQSGPIIAPALYRELFKPLHARMNEWVHRNTSWKTFFHTCGDVTTLLDDFIESGLDILNPVQISAAHMEPEFLKESYGDRLVFWGGGISTQKTLPFGSPAEIAMEAAYTSEIFGKDGGFVFAPDQNIQPTVPIENVMALIESLRRIRR